MTRPTNSRKRLPDIFQGTTDPERDMKTERRVVLESRDENDFRVTQKPECPHGYWYISRDKGTVPVVLSGRYTTFAAALQAVKIYLNSFALPRPIKEIIQ